MKSQSLLGDCYEANGNFIVDLLRDNININNCTICHGKVIGAKGSPVEGQTFDHAWIEINNHILDFSNGKKICVKKEILYNQGRILTDTVKRYTPKEFANLVLKYGHWGSFKGDS